MTKVKNNKQKLLVKRIKENPSSSLKDSMLSAGYSLSVAKNPKSVVSRPSFQELMESNGLTDQYLTDKLKEGLESTKLIIHQSEVLEPPDYISRHKYLETALKTKGHLSNISNQYNLQANDYRLVIDNTDIDKSKTKD